jgi:hypothetical protein
LSASGAPPGSFAVSRRSVIGVRFQLKRWPKPATKASSGTCRRAPAAIDGTRTVWFRFSLISTSVQSCAD